MKNILLILFLLLLGPCLIAQEYITINDKPYRIDTLIYKHRVGPGTEYVLNSNRQCNSVEFIVS